MVRISRQGTNNHRDLSTALRFGRDDKGVRKALPLTVISMERILG
jgi:hypothetical protein